MLRIEPQPFTEMKAHAEATYPNECVGAMIGTIDRRIAKIDLYK